MDDLASRVLALPPVKWHVHEAVLARIHKVDRTCLSDALAQVYRFILLHFLTITSRCQVSGVYSYYVYLRSATLQSFSLDDGKENQRRLCHVGCTGNVLRAFRAVMGKATVPSLGV